MRKVDPVISLPCRFVNVPASVILGLPARELKLWAIIRSHCVDTELCFPSTNRLAALLGLGYRQTFEALNRLEKTGYIAREKRRGRSSIIRILTPDEPMRISAGVPSDLCGFPQGGSAENCIPPMRISADIITRTESKELDHSDQLTRRGLTSQTSKPANAKKTDPRIKGLIDHFCAAYHERFNIKYTVAGAKDGAIAKELLKDHEPETLKKCVDEFLSDPDPWLDGKRTIGVFKSRVNQYTQRLASQQIAEPTPPAHRRLALT